MILERIRNIKSGRDDLRSFGITMAVVLGLIGSYLSWRAGSYHVVLMTLAWLFLIVGVIVPVILKPVHKIWMTISIVLGTVMTALILLLLFYLVFTPAGLLAKLLGKQFLVWRVDPAAKTYWIPKEELSADPSRYERQF